ncbi:MAG: radical SAM protein [Alphaproteobacteria bacterium]|nr:radical SAM protein [Alphaproteobacteria bacterium]
MSAPRTLDFADHRRELGANRYVYPVVSRRSGGLSVGVNLNPDKVCNFDCPYCQVDRTVPPHVTRVELPTLEAELDVLLGLAAGGHIWELAPFDTVAPALRRVNDVAFAGDGEPTAYRGFGEAVAIAGRLLKKHGLAHVKPIVLTNATLLHRPRVAEALRALDALGGEIWAKLDAGTEPYFRFVDGTTFPFGRILDNLSQAAQERPIVIQSMFLTWDGEGPSDAEIGAYWGRLADVLAAGGALKHVQVYSVARIPANPRIGPLDEARLEVIAQGVRDLGVPAEVYPGRDV